MSRFIVFAIIFLLSLPGCSGGFNLYTGEVFQCPEELLTNLEKKVDVIGLECLSNFEEKENDGE